MYQLDPDSGEIREYPDYFSNEAERQYWMEIVDLSYDIYDTLQRLKNDPEEQAVKSLFKQKTFTWPKQVMICQFNGASSRASCNGMVILFYPIKRYQEIL